MMELMHLMGPGGVGRMHPILHAILATDLPCEGILWRIGGMAVMCSC